MKRPVKGLYFFNTENNLTHQGCMYVLWVGFTWS